MALKDWLIENGVGGIRFDAEERRVYNNQSLASPVLGMTRNEGGKLVGVSGLEAQYNALLSGEDGYLFARRNNYSSKGVIPFSTPISYPAKDSLHLVSTLDMEIQTILQEELLSVASSAGLNRGVHGLVMEVGTGDVLAMGQVGGYDAANPSALLIGMIRENGISCSDRRQNICLQLWNNINITDVHERINSKPSRSRSARSICAWRVPVSVTIRSPFRGSDSRTRGGTEILRCASLLHS